MVSCSKVFPVYVFLRRIHSAEYDDLWEYHPLGFHVVSLRYLIIVRVATAVIIGVRNSHRVSSVYKFASNKLENVLTRVNIFVEIEFHSMTLRYQILTRVTTVFE